MAGGSQYNHDGAGGRPDDGRDQQPTPDWDEFQADIKEAQYDWVSHWVEEIYYVWKLVEVVFFVAMEAWTTHVTEATCPECIALNGAEWEQASGEGAFPPAHTNCRCTRAFSRMDRRTRMELQRFRETRQVQVWDWEITGWA